MKVSDAAGDADPNVSLMLSSMPCQRAVQLSPSFLI